MSDAAEGEAVRITGLEKSYGEWPVLWDLDLRLPWGQTLVLFGANGAGKTTLLRVLSTHARADSGSVTVAGRDLRRQPNAVRRRIGVVGHRSFLYEDLTCRENLVYYARLYNLPNPGPRAEAALARVGLAGRANHRVRTLSNGMQKRAAIARAIVHEPSVLLLDEPEAGLDQDSVAMLGNLLEDWTSSGRSVVMTTHDLELGVSWASQVGILTMGKVTIPGSGEALGPEELRAALTASARRRAETPGISGGRPA